MSMETKTPERAPVTAEKIEALMEQKQAQTTWKPTVGGVLAIVSGYINILMGLFLWIRAATGHITAVSMGLGVTAGIVALALGILAVIGGSFAVSRKAYPMSMIGSIASMFPGLGVIPGTLSLIWVSLSRKEFHPKR